MRFGLVPLIAVVLLTIVASPAAGAAESLDDRPGELKGKKKRCKKGQAKVKSGKRVRCLPLSKKAVQPRAEDPRLAAIKAGLTPALLSAPDPGDKLPPPMEKVYRGLGPKALPAMEGAVAGALRRLDAGAARPLGRGLGAFPLAFTGSGYTETVGNVTIDIRLNFAGVASAEFALTVKGDDGRSVIVAFEVPELSGAYKGFSGDVCPGADGKLTAKDGLGLTIRTEVRSDGGKKLDAYLIWKVVDKSDLRAEVGDDAKLDRLEINNQQEVTETSYDSAIYSGASVKALITREGTVDMRSGSLNTTINNVNVGAVLSGAIRLLSGTFQAGLLQRLRKAADEGWAASVKFETERFREREAGWNTPNNCAKLKFGRANRSLTLKAGESGNESVQVDAVRGGSPQKADWTIGGQQNATFTLTAHGTNPTSFDYKVARTGKGVEVNGRLRAVTRAGVAEESWIQKTEEPPSINNIDGSFGGELLGTKSPLGTRTRQVWSGLLEADRATPSQFGGAAGVYLVKAGTVSITASGLDGSGITGCLQTGFAEAPLNSGAVTVLGSGEAEAPPYIYEIDVFLPPVSIKIQRHDCPKGAEDYEGTSDEIGPFWQLHSDVQESVDGTAFVDATKLEEGGVVFEQSWTLHGTP